MSFSLHLHCICITFIQLCITFALHLHYICITFTLHLHLHVHYICSTCSLHLHYVYIHLHYVYTTFTLQLHYIYITFTLHLHYNYITFAVFALHLHYIYITFTLRLHYICITFTLHLHYIYITFAFTCALHLQYMFITFTLRLHTFTLRLHYIYITIALHLHYVYVTFALQLHYICSICITFTLHLHYIYITFTLHLHYIYITSAVVEGTPRDDRLIRNFCVRWIDLCTAQLLAKAHPAQCGCRSEDVWMVSCMQGKSWKIHRQAESTLLQNGYSMIFHRFSMIFYLFSRFLSWFAVLFFGSSTSRLVLDFWSTGFSGLPRYSGGGWIESRILLGCCWSVWRFGVFVWLKKLDYHMDWYMAMGQYLYIPFLGGWTSIYQLFWCSPGG